MNISVVNDLVIRGASLQSILDASSGANAILPPTNTPLLNFLTMKRRFDDVLTLVARGADINIRSVNGVTPLKVSLIRGDVDFSQKLILRHAEFNPSDKWNELCFALNSGKEKAVNFVLKSTSNDIFSENTFLIAIHRNNYDFTKNNLMKYRGDINALKAKLLKRLAGKKAHMDLVTDILK